MAGCRSAPVRGRSPILWTQWDAKIKDWFVDGDVHDDEITAVFAVSDNRMALRCPPSSFAGQELAIAGTAKVKPEQARSIALKARPGAITTEELEKEKGGSGFRYSFVVKSGTALYEVGVDAQTGKVLEN